MSTGDLPLTSRLERIESKQDEILEALAALRTEIAVLRAKAAIYGAGAGLVVAAAVSKLVGG